MTEEACTKAKVKSEKVIMFDKSSDEDTSAKVVSKIVILCHIQHHLFYQTNSHTNPILAYRFLQGLYSSLILERGGGGAALFAF